MKQNWWWKHRDQTKSSMVKTLLEGESCNLNYTNTIINKKLQTATSGLKYLYKQLTKQVQKRIL
jgi:ribosomal protein S20